jgi:hypothetical protein
LTRASIFAVLSLALLGCGRVARRDDNEASRTSGIVLRGSELTSNLLDGIRARIPGTTISYQRGGCPRILFRGRRSVDQYGTPSVYVDGTLTIDTCVLTTLSVTEIDRVEVFTGGNTSRADVRPNPSGLIFVYRINR